MFQVLRIPRKQKNPAPFLDEDCVVVADDFNPTEIVQLEIDKLLALVLEKGVNLLRVSVFQGYLVEILFYLKESVNYVWIKM